MMLYFLFEIFKTLKVAHLVELRLLIIKSHFRFHDATSVHDDSFNRPTRRIDTFGGVYLDAA